MDMVNVGPFASSGRRRLLSVCCELWRRLAVNKRRWYQAKQCDGDNAND
jgi:hypothetical protein